MRNLEGLLNVLVRFLRKPAGAHQRHRHAGMFLELLLERRRIRNGGVLIKRLFVAIRRKMLVGGLDQLSDVLGRRR